MGRRFAADGGDQGFFEISFGLDTNVSMNGAGDHLVTYTDPFGNLLGTMWDAADQEIDAVLLQLLPVQSDRRGSVDPSGERKETMDKGR